MLLSHMDLRWRTIGQTLMEPFMVVEHEVAFEACLKGRDGRIVLEVHVLIRDRPPSPFDKEIVQRAAPAIHADRDPRSRQAAGEGEARELDALVGVEHRWTALHQRHV